MAEKNSNSNDSRTGRFSLQNIRSQISDFRNKPVGSSNGSREELSKNAVVKSLDGSDHDDIRKPFEYEYEDYDRTEAPKDQMRKYWRQFETTPIIRKPVTSFASRVMEPGYFIETTDLTEEEVKRIGQWLDQAAILEGQPGRDFRLLVKKAIIQREVRGTCLVEVSPHKNDEDKIAGLKLINPETMEAVTRPNQNILLAPDDIEEYEGAPSAESGGAAAWLQDVLETDNSFWGNTSTNRDASTDGDIKIGFRRDEIIPLTRDADVGEVFGTSRIEAVSDRIDGIKQKLADNDEAIASKAYPLWLFMFGSDENPWNSDDIQSFMSAHEMENFHPGMKQGVRGDVSVETISGEVADIAEYLQFDLRWIMSAMPMPMFVLGSFESASVGQVAGVAQQQDVNRQIKEARREIEEEFTPVVRKVAMQQGVDKDRAKNITLKIGKPGETDLDIDRNEQVIRYISGSQGGSTQTQGGQPSREAQPNTEGDQRNADQRDDGVVGKGETPETINNPTPDQPIAGVSDDGNPYADMVGSESASSGSPASMVWDAPYSTEQLSYMSSERDEIANTISAVFTKARDRTLDKLEDRYQSTPQYAVAEFENVANRELNQSLREENLYDSAKSAIDSELTNSLSVLEINYNTNSYTSNTKTDFYAQNVENATRDATEEMLRKMRIQVRRAITGNETWSEARRRVEQDFTDSYLQDRASLIAQMEMKSAVESEKLSQFEQDDSVIGYTITNSNQRTPLTQELSGTQVLFDSVEDVKDAYPDVEKYAHEGFNPLPRAPPFHYQDTSTLEPIFNK